MRLLLLLSSCVHPNTIVVRSLAYSGGSSWKNWSICWVFVNQINWLGIITSRIDLIRLSSSSLFCRIWSLRILFCEVFYLIKSLPFFTLISSRKFVKDFVMTVDNSRCLLVIEKVAFPGSTIPQKNTLHSLRIQVFWNVDVIRTSKHTQMADIRFLFVLGFKRCYFLKGLSRALLYQVCCSRQSFSPKFVW